MRNHERGVGLASASRLRKIAPAAAILSLPFMLCSCAVGPNFTKPEAPINDKWRAQDDHRVATQSNTEPQWWKQFNDGTLDRLIDAAYGQNLPLQVTGLKIVEARAHLGLATGKQFPQVQVVGGDVTAVKYSNNWVNIPNFDREFLNYQIGFDAIWELDFWGKYRRGVQAEAASLLATVADYYYGLVSLTAEVARTYALIRTFEVLIEQAQENARLQEDGLKIAESRFHNGATSELDVTQATTLLESTRATVPQLQISLQQSRNALTTLLGQTTGSVETLLAGRREIPKPPSKVAVSVPAEMLRRRPDIRGAELLAAAQCARIGVAKAELYPSFSLFGSIGLRATNSGGDARNLFSTDSLYYAFGPKISWPFFNYGRLTNNVRIEDARFQQLLVNYRSTVLRAAQEVEDSLTGFLHSQDVQKFQENAVTAALRSAEIAVIQYREGAVDYQRVLDAQRSLLQQQNALTQTKSTLAIHLIALHKALGGGWESRQGQPVIPENTQKEMKARSNWGDVLSQPRSVETKDNKAAEKR
jgi:NodT family efflux transporter outer membrane factor (OMF) lipoprotein